MILRDAGVVTLIWLLFLAGIGYMSAKTTGKDDARLEEAIEVHIENNIENIIGVKRGTLAGTIDLTPSSSEKDDPE